MFRNHTEVKREYLFKNLNALLTELAQMDYGLSDLHSKPQSAIGPYLPQMAPKHQRQLGYRQCKQHKGYCEQCRILPIMHNSLDEIQLKIVIVIQEIVPERAGSIVVKARGCLLRSWIFFNFHDSSSKLFARMRMGVLISNVSSAMKAS